jgi:hypothetical protein
MKMCVPKGGSFPGKFGGFTDYLGWNLYLREIELGEHSSAHYEIKE